MKIVVINDVHFSARQPRSRTPAYTDQILVKLIEVRQFCVDNDVDVVCLTGDSFHRKDEPYWICGGLARVLMSMGRVRIAAIGNHDWDGIPDRFSHFPAFYAYGLAGVRYDVRSGKVWQEVDPETQTGVEVVVINSDLEEVSDIWKVCNWNYTNTTKIVIAHQPIVPSHLLHLYPKPMHDVIIPAEQLQNIATFVFYGDIHDAHGVYTRGNTTFVNFGSLARNSAKELSADRVISVAYLDTDTGDLAPLELENVVPAKDAFLSDEIYAQKEYDEERSQFVESLGKTEFQVLTKDVLREQLMSSSLQESEKKLGSSIVDAVAD